MKWTMLAAVGLGLWLLLVCTCEGQYSNDYDSPSSSSTPSLSGSFVAPSSAPYLQAACGQVLSTPTDASVQLKKRLSAGCTFALLAPAQHRVMFRVLSLSSSRDIVFYEARTDRAPGRMLATDALWSGGAYVTYSNLLNVSVEVPLGLETVVELVFSFSFVSLSCPANLTITNTTGSLTLSAAPSLDCRQVVQFAPGVNLTANRLRFTSTSSATTLAVQDPVARRFTKFNDPYTSQRKVVETLLAVATLTWDTTATYQSERSGFQWIQDGNKPLSVTISYEVVPCGGDGGGGCEVVLTDTPSIDIGRFTLPAPLRAAVLAVSSMADNNSNNNNNNTANQTTPVSSESTTKPATVLAKQGFVMAFFVPNLSPDLSGVAVFDASTLTAFVCFDSSLASTLSSLTEVSSRTGAKPVSVLRFTGKSVPTSNTNSSSTMEFADFRFTFPPKQ